MDRHQAHACMLAKALLAEVLRAPKQARLAESATDPQLAARARAILAAALRKASR